MAQESVPMGRRADTAADSEAVLLTPTAPDPLRLTHPTSTMITWGAVGLGYSLIGGTFRRLTIPAEIATLLPGAAIVWYALRPATDRFPAPDAAINRRTTLPWAVLAVAFGIWELYAAARGSTHAHPTLSILLGPLIDPPPARAAGYVAWLLAGVWVVRR
ncbi:hypothetical protein [Catenulispora pinisilvae]|uniref:hypothetical protein n=1 Tax=Catenulispora pinisilvae TaxID=2705253 RepID=UPI0018915F26|nr:hypothetical protein [Catenulispora pinisilvae]